MNAKFICKKCGKEVQSSHAADKRNLCYDCWEDEKAAYMDMETPTKKDKPTTINYSCKNCNEDFNDCDCNYYKPKYPMRKQKTRPDQTTTQFLTEKLEEAQERIRFLMEVIIEIQQIQDPRKRRRIAIEALATIQYEQS